MERGDPENDRLDMREIPASYYLVFFHPAYDYLKDNGGAWAELRSLHGITILKRRSAEESISGMRKPANAISGIILKFSDMRFCVL